MNIVGTMGQTISGTKLRWPGPAIAGTAAAAAMIDEVDSITQATGMPPLKYAAVMLAAARGDQAQTQALLDWGRRNTTERGEGSALGQVGWFAALLHNGHGHYGDALTAARQACEHEDVMAYGFALVELIEARVMQRQRPAALLYFKTDAQPEPRGELAFERHRVGIMDASSRRTRRRGPALHEPLGGANVEPAAHDLLDERGGVDGPQ